MQPLTTKQLGTSLLLIISTLALTACEQIKYEFFTDKVYEYPVAKIIEQHYLSSEKYQSESSFYGFNITFNETAKEHILDMQDNFEGIASNKIHSIITVSVSDINNVPQQTEEFHQITYFTNNPFRILGRKIQTENPSDNEYMVVDYFYEPPEFSTIGSQNELYSAIFYQDENKDVVLETLSVNWRLVAYRKNTAHLCIATISSKDGLSNDTCLLIDKDGNILDKDLYMIMEGKKIKFKRV